MDGLTLRIEGDKELERTLEAMSRRLRSSIMRKALRAGSRPIIVQARANLQGFGLTRKSSLSKQMGVRIKQYQQGRVWVAIVGVRSPVAHIAYWYEFGTQPRWTKSPRRFKGIMPARPFLRPAFEATKGKALRVIRERAWSEVRKAAAQRKK